MEAVWKLPFVMSLLFFTAPVNSVSTFAGHGLPQVAVGLRYRQCQLWPHKGQITIKGNESILEVSGTSPMGEAIATIYRRYQWIVDFEEPTFKSNIDLCASSVETGFPGLQPATRPFRSIYPTPSLGTRSAKTEEEVLNKIVSDYNRSGNPGKFAVEDEGHGRYAVVGRYVKDDDGKVRMSTPILDTLISLPLRRRKVLDALKEISDELNKSGSNISIHAPPNANEELLIGGDNLPARVLLSQSVETPGAGVEWRLSNQVSYRPDLTQNSDALVFSRLISFSIYAAPPGPTPLVYRNIRYGFTFSLPTTWKNYGILVDNSPTSFRDESNQNVREEVIPIIVIRNPHRTKSNPYQDIPIMVFTKAQWKTTDNGELMITAAPFGPTEIWRNAKYVFALPPRYNAGALEGYNQVDDIIQHHPFHSLPSR